MSDISRPPVLADEGPAPTATPPAGARAAGHDGAPGAVGVPDVAAVPATAAAATVLCVDDEPPILASLKRLLRGGGLTILTAQSAAEGLEILERVSVDLVISDMRMPVLDGARFLEQVYLRWPQVVRILLTGYADLADAVAAVNRGRVFRYMHKPWDPDDLRATVRQGLEMQRLETERARLQQLTREQNQQLQALNADLETRVLARTAELRQANVRMQRNHLKTIKVLTDLIELRSGALSGHGRRVAELARAIARRMGLAEDAVLDIFKAGLLHDIGLVGVDDALLAPTAPAPQRADDARAPAHPAHGAVSLRGLDEMAAVADLIEAHHEHVDGSGFPAGLRGDAIPLGARILAVADALDALEGAASAPGTVARGDAIARLRRDGAARFDARVLACLDVLLDTPATPP